MTDGVTEQGRMSVLQRKKHPTLLIQKQQKITTFNFVLTQVRLILFNTNLNPKNSISYVQTVLKKL